MEGCFVENTPPAKEIPAGSSHKEPSKRKLVLKKEFETSVPFYQQLDESIADNDGDWIMEGDFEVVTRTNNTYDRQHTGKDPEPEDIMPNKFDNLSEFASNSGMEYTKDKEKELEARLEDLISDTDKYLQNYLPTRETMEEEIIEDLEQFILDMEGPLTKNGREINLGKDL